MGALVLFLFLAIMPWWGATVLGTSNTYCNSWRFAVETNNSVGWSVVPKDCADCVADYMAGKQYPVDCHFVVEEAIKYVDSLGLTKEATWVLDIDETALSNLPYYARPDVAYGAKGRGIKSFYEWVEAARVPALPATLKLYKHLISKKVKIVFLTGAKEVYREARVKNLDFAGYEKYDELILKKDSEKDLHGAAFKLAKRKELEDSGEYKIIGNIGDQWSDLIGTNVGDRTFKLPNPMYYIP